MLTLLAWSQSRYDVDGWQTRGAKPTDHIVDLAARSDSLAQPEDTLANSDTIRDGAESKSRNEYERLT